jgi:hypothetical protein
VERLYPGGNWPLAGRYVVNRAIGNVGEGRVSFLFTKRGFLEQVMVEFPPSEPKPRLDRPESLMVPKLLFQELENLLTAKYGKPIRSSKNGPQSGLAALSDDAYDYSWLTSGDHQGTYCDDKIPSCARMQIFELARLTAAIPGFSGVNIVYEALPTHPNTNGL